ncbi:SRPBCC family protein [Mycobacterium sp. E796]|uniref:SRPBCC family protein n=1 Tax=Mycobacterium sp. E796 TaxID=1834151 RepID=UPI0007FB9798|nr:SRPBCC family protein [Mycobacterium sp. E796]OBI55614.1 polyketide cyclase [Mycobacterium sp. E796]
MVEIHVERTIAAPVGQVFDWLADPANLAAAPLVLRAGYAKDSPGHGAGAVREVVGIGTWFREEITAYDRPGGYSYLIVRSFPPFNHEGGTLTFTGSTFTGSKFTGSGDGTHVDWLSNYTHPALAGGKLLEVVSYRLLRSSFLAILDACANALETE